MDECPSLSAHMTTKPTIASTTQTTISSSTTTTTTNNNNTQSLQVGVRSGITISNNTTTRVQSHPTPVPFDGDTKIEKNLKAGDIPNLMHAEPAHRFLSSFISSKVLHNHKLESIASERGRCPSR
jgi:hypothetical protein